MTLLTEMPRREFFAEVLKACMREVGTPTKFLKVFGDVNFAQVGALKDFCKWNDFLLIEDDEDLKVLFLFLDKNIEAVERVLTSYGLCLTLLFNIRFHEDWSSFHPIEPDNLDDATREEWQWNTIQQEMMEYFHHEFRQDLYNVVGIRFCSDELISWIRSFVSDTENERWWETNIRNISYTTDS
jgi:hypothetical protein